MKNPLSLKKAVLVASVLCLGSAAQAWHVNGVVWCDTNGNQQMDPGDTPLANVAVMVANSGGTFSATANTNADGSFYIELPHTPDSYVVQLQTESLPGGTSLLLPAGGVHAFALGHPPALSDRFESANFLLNCDSGEAPPPEAGEGVRTPGYWKNHPDAWPEETITVGGVVYTKAEAIEMMSGGGSDRSLTMFSHLVATKLNLMAGNSDTCIVDTVEAADVWLTEFTPGSGVRANSAAWRQAEAWKDLLDSYNNGQLCAAKGD